MSMKRDSVFKALRMVPSTQWLLFLGSHRRRADAGPADGSTSPCVPASFPLHWHDCSYHSLLTALVLDLQQPRHPQAPLKLHRRAQRCGGNHLSSEIRRKASRCPPTESHYYIQLSGETTTTALLEFTFRGESFA